MRIQLNTCGHEFNEHSDIEMFKKRCSRNEKRSFPVSCHDFVFFICPNCGAELYSHSKWLTLAWSGAYTPEYRAAVSGDEKIVEEEIARIHAVSTCPLCSGALSRKFPYFVRYSSGVFPFERDNNDTIFYDIQKLATYYRIQKEGIPQSPNDEHSEYQANTISKYEKNCWTDMHARLFNRDDSHPFHDLYNLPSVEEVFFQLSNEISKDLRGPTKEEAKKKAHSLDIHTTSPITEESLATIKSSPIALKNHISEIIALENNIYSLTLRLADLYWQRFFSRQSVSLAEGIPAYNTWQAEQLISSRSNALSAAQGKSIPDVKYPAAPKEPVLAVPGWFNKKKVQAENEALTAKYQDDLKKYNNKCAECDAEKARLEKEKQLEIAAAEKALNEAKREHEQLLSASGSASSEGIALPEKAALALVEKEISEAESLLKNLFECRNKLYSFDIIFEKYRDVVSLSSFYEYLASGRCSSLEGADGAYNIYENEIRMNLIISQLDTVVSSLEEIKQNQYKIYKELHSINDSLSSLNHTMNSALTAIQGIGSDVAQIAQNTEVIAYNTAATAYYSKINAELTNSLGYMVAIS